MRMGSSRWTTALSALGIVAIWATTATAYPMFRNTHCVGGTNVGASCKVDSACPGGACTAADDCSQCHGSFLASPYQSCNGGSNNAAKCTAASECPGGTCEAWSGPLHNVHRNNMLGVVAPDTPDPGRCNICHIGSSKTPVFINESNGTTGYDPISCIGCHGRAADRGVRPGDCVDAQTTNGPCGDGAGLRQHHQNSGITVCADCHADALPANFTPAGENVPPTYYFTPDSAHPLKPTNPCNPNGEEDYESSPDGLDNDGDLLYDTADSDCPTPTASATPQITPTPTATLTPGPAPSPNAASQKCQAAIVKSAAAFVQAKTKALQKCEDGVVKRKITGPCPDAKAAESIAKAQTKLDSGIAKACGGKNKACESGGDDVPLDLLGWPAACPDFEDKGCTNAIANCGDIATCVACTGEVAVDQAIELYYGTLQPTDPKSKDKHEKSLNKCQGTIGKAGAKFLAAQSKALQKCWDGKAKGKINDCPDVPAGDAISKAAVKLASTINGTCGGKDKQPGGSGDDADFSPTEIGFRASCLDVTFPGFITPCAGAVTDLQSLVGCVTCVTRFKVGCADRAGALGLGSYPDECNP
jgi:hypothetical protein